MSETNLEVLRRILLSVFPNSFVPEEIADIKMGDLDEWDSLGNFSLLLTVEQNFQLEFTMEELMTIHSVRDLLVKIDSK